MPTRCEHEQQLLQQLHVQGLGSYVGGGRALRLAVPGLSWQPCMYGAPAVWAQHLICCRCTWPCMSPPASEGCLLEHRTDFLVSAGEFHFTDLLDKTWQRQSAETAITGGSRSTVLCRRHADAQTIKVQNCVNACWMTVSDKQSLWPGGAPWTAREPSCLPCTVTAACF